MNLCPLFTTTDLTSERPNIAQNNVLKLSSTLKLEKESFESRKSKTEEQKSRNVFVLTL